MRLKRRSRRQPRSPRNSLRSVRLSRMPRSLSLCELTGTFLITFKKPDRAGKIKGSWEVDLRLDQPVRSHDRVPMAGKEEYGLPQRHPRPKGRYDTLSLFSKLHSPPSGRYRALWMKGVRNDRRARSSSAVRLKPDPTPERCS